MERLMNESATVAWAAPTTTTTTTMLAMRSMLTVWLALISKQKEMSASLAEMQETAKLIQTLLKDKDTTEHLTAFLAYLNENKKEKEEILKHEGQE